MLPRIVWNSSSIDVVTYNNPLIWGNTQYEHLCIIQQILQEASRALPIHDLIAVPAHLQVMKLSKTVEQ